MEYQSEAISRYLHVRLPYFRGLPESLAPAPKLKDPRKTGETKGDGSATFAVHRAPIRPKGRYYAIHEHDD